ncbi:MAG TPA: NAD(P)/FAD-dependent oxidoreductase [Pyrinomonadaceae bacterium]|jgi:protoporphyrinogen oxidase|nr:NAD(P)/FAD-dependent oxidoreductase [Pyrinomonadaceae bacterium]
MSQRKKCWAIVGGGLLGMTLAHRLARAGECVTLFEGAGELGGLASAWQIGDVVWDRHYHVTLLSDTSLRALLCELGLEEEMRWVETKTGFYADGKLYSMSDSLEFLRFPPLGLIDKLRLGANIFYASKVRRWQRLEKIPASVWLKRWSGRRTFEKIWLPLLRAKLGDNYAQTSAAFIWATIARMYAARRTGLKKEMFGYVSGGYARILARFADVLAGEGVNIKLRQRVVRVEPSATGAGVCLELAEGDRETFDEVILTTPANVAARVCTGLSAEERARLEGVRYQGIICASLLLKQPLANFYVTNITDAGLPFTAVIEMTALVDRAQFGGHALVYLPKYLDAADAAFASSDAEIEAQFLAALERMYPHFRRSDLVSFRVSRVRQVFPIPTLNYSTQLPAQATSHPAIHIINSAHILNGTLNVNETVQLAEAAAARLLSVARQTEARV